MIVRSPRPEAHFTILANDLLRDPQLTLRAKGLLAMLLSYPDNWRTSAETLSRQSPEGRDSIRRTLDELEQAGFLRRRKTQNEAGQWITETVIFDTRQKSPTFSTECPQPTTVNQSSVSQASKEELLKKTSPVKKSINSTNRAPSICGKCSGTSWKPHGKQLIRCDCDGGLTR